MKRFFIAAICSGLVLLFIGTLAMAQNTPVNYGNIPDSLVAFDRYQKPQVSFLEPTWFYGAGREAPTGLTEVRIGAGPLEFHYPTGRADDARCNSCCRRSQ